MPDFGLTNWGSILNRLLGFKAWVQYDLGRNQLVSARLKEIKPMRAGDQNMGGLETTPQQDYIKGYFGQSVGTIVVSTVVQRLSLEREEKGELCLTTPESARTPAPQAGALHKISVSRIESSEQSSAPSPAEEQVKSVRWSHSCSVKLSRRAASQTPHRRRVKGNLPSPLVSRACEGCISTLRDYSDSSTLDHVIANYRVNFHIIFPELIGKTSAFLFFHETERKG
uniref:Uncharacterized protein n=1 Tax=Timema bartmani TaxID=61472 RepID=A0A7R9ES02_9NEOP|nr:unnamed protein product [Timema bartmani]